MTLSYPIRTNDTETFTLIYNEYFERMYSFARRFIPSDDIADLLHDIFVSVWKSGNEFQNEQVLLVYLQRSVKNRCLYHLQSVHHKYKEVPEDIQEKEVFLIEAAFIKSLNQAVDNLTKQQKLIIELRYLKGLPFPEIVSITGLNYRTIHRHRQDAIKALRKVIRPPH